MHNTCKKVFRKKSQVLRLCCLAALVSPGLQAQVLEEIVVTAERRETSLQDTPISVLSFSSEIMEARGVQTIEDLATNSPNLDIKGSRGTGNVSPTYQIRGISGGGGATGEEVLVSTLMVFLSLARPVPTCRFLIWSV